MSDGHDQSPDSSPAATPSDATPSDAEPKKRKPSNHVVAIPAAVTLISGAAVAFAFSRDFGGPWTLISNVGGAYVPLVLAALYWLHKNHTLKRSLMPSSGDLSIGALLAGGFYAVGAVAQAWLLPTGSAYRAWLIRIYWHLADGAESIGLATSLALIAIAAAEEIVWRGWVMGVMARVLGDRRAWLYTTALYTLAHIPTAIILSDPIAGPNPLLAFAAGTAGLAWGYLAMKTGRLGPSIFAHALFIWSIAKFPLLLLRLPTLLP